jgi:prepilin-type N-terminal cleavage/methylation domain-containing protein
MGSTINPKDSYTGFTMVEIVVALAILSTTTVAVFGAMQTCAKAAHHTRMLTQSVLLAESLLVETMLSGNMVFETKEGEKNRYSWEVQIVPTPVESLGAIHVKVQWREQQRQQQYELFSLVQMRSFTESE